MKKRYKPICIGDLYFIIDSAYPSWVSDGGLCVFGYEYPAKHNRPVWSRFYKTRQEAEKALKKLKKFIKEKL